MVSQVSRETWGSKETGWGALCIKCCPRWNELNSCVFGGQQWFVMCVVSIGGVWNGWVTWRRWSWGSKRPIWSQWRVRSHWSCWWKSIFSLFLCQEPEVDIFDLVNQNQDCSVLLILPGKTGCPRFARLSRKTRTKGKIWVEEFIYFLEMLQQLW